MIKLFEFQKTEIRTETINGKLWFSGADVFLVLGLTWKGIYDVQRRNLGEANTHKIITLTKGGNQSMVYLNKEAVILLTLSVRKLDITKRNLFLNNLGIQECDLKINRPETIFINSLKPILNGLGLDYTEQYEIGKYKIDMYVPLLGFIEYDELNHCLKKDKVREKEIKLILDKPFLRCKQGNEDIFLRNIILKVVSIGINSLCNEIKKELKNNNQERVDILLNIYS